jgi:MiaB/RimO family radical SAM methylthiotransferase
LDSIVREVRHLESIGIRQITLLGQNVNSYRDLSTPSNHERNSLSSSDFKPIYKYRTEGLHFVDLLDAVSAAAPGVRFRFTSPHPQFFPLDLLKLISSRPNIAKQIHLPAQSGSDTVLARMRRGYTKAAYLSLVERIRKEIPNVTLSSDFIVGFCEETEDEFQETLDLAEQVQYDMAYNFAYSLREKTKAHRTLVDDVSPAVKKERLARLNAVYESGRLARLDAIVGREEIVLIERQIDGGWTGRSDGNVRVNVLGDLEQPIQKGDFVRIQTSRRQGGTLIGAPISHTALS